MSIAKGFVIGALIFLGAGLGYAAYTNKSQPKAKIVIACENYSSKIDLQASKVEQPYSNTLRLYDENGNTMTMILPNSATCVIGQAK